MTNRDMAAMLFNIATLLRNQGDNPFRVRAYLNGARSLMRRASDDMVAPLRASDKPLPHPKGILGERVQRRLKELIETGRMETLAELCEGLPAHVGALMQVPGVGPRLAQRFHDTLGVETPEQLRSAACAGRLQSVWGVGPKRQAQFTTQLSLFDEPAPEQRMTA